jgi:WD40 repeat protein
MRTLAGHSANVNSARFSPDGLWVVTASDDHTARIWNAQTGDSIVLAGHEEAVSEASFSPDGRWIVTASHDDTMRIWDAATGRPAAIFSWHRDWLTGAAFSPDGGRVVTASRDKTARIGNVAPTNHGDETQGLVEQAKHAIDRCLIGEQRIAAFLDPEPPAWCIDMAKWPYATDEWKSWLAAKRAGRAGPLPDAGPQ